MDRVSKREGINNGFFSKLLERDGENGTLGFSGAIKFTQIA